MAARVYQHRMAAMTDRDAQGIVMVMGGAALQADGAGLQCGAEPAP